MRNTTFFIEANIAFSEKGNSISVTLDGTYQILIIILLNLKSSAKSVAFCSYYNVEAIKPGHTLLKCLLESRGFRGNCLWYLVSSSQNIRNHGNRGVEKAKTQRHQLVNHLK